MRNFINNTGYFLKETKIVLHTNWLSNVFSVFSTGLIFFILTMMISAWWISSEVVHLIQNEAEISVYFSEDITRTESEKLVEKMHTIGGVEDVRLVNESEAYDRMSEVLGKEATVLEYFNENPFSSFIEIKIDFEQIDAVLETLGYMDGIEYIRDNREVLDRIHSISEVLGVLGYLVIAAAGISTIVIISHIIRLGVYNNREQINTLRLLGAPEFFIAFPYLLEGVLLTLGGGILSAILATFTVQYVYAQIAGPLPFIPLPSKEILINNLSILILCLSIGLGMIGSLMGLSSAKNE